MSSYLMIDSRDPQEASAVGELREMQKEALSKELDAKS